MLWYKRNPIFYSLLAILIGGVLTAVWMVQKSQAELKDLENAYLTKSRVLDRFLVKKPSPTRGNLEALNQNYSDLYEIYEKVLSELSLNTFDKELFFGTDPVTKTDAFFEIARYMEDLKKIANRTEVSIGDEERFGFSEYANVGPEDDDIPTVHKQVKIMQFLLEALFESGVSGFEGIQREKNNSVLAGSARGRQSPKGDIFVLDPAESIRTQDVLSSLAFKVVFRSQSLGMRNFINRIIDSSLPFVICSINVSSDTTEARSEKRVQVVQNPFANPVEGDQLIKAAQVPIVSENESNFSVTIEFMEEVETFRKISEKVKKEGGE